MAQNAEIIEHDDPVLIEEQVDTGLQQLLEHYRPAFSLAGERRDTLNQRFTLYPGKPLPEFSHAYAKAFEAADSQNDEREIYAMVCENTLPYRQHAVNALIGQSSPTMTTLLGAGVVQCSQIGEARMVLFFERPQGTRLSDMLASHGRIHEHRVLDNVLHPAVKALKRMAELNIGHGNIQPSNFFVSDEPTLGECVSAPCDSLLPYLYEPPERIVADPLGRGEANEKSDCYALGVLAYEMIYGLDKLKTYSQEDFVRLSLELGTYHVFAHNREFSDTFQDFFRGVFTDNPTERWGYDQLRQWLGGKRFNMIAPSPPKEAGRPLSFLGKNYFGGRVLANEFHNNWRESVKEIKSLKLDRWCDMSLHRPEMAERIERALRIAGDASTERHTNDMMTRVISVLDPTGPLRGMLVNVRPDGIGTMLSTLVNDQQSPELSQLLAFIETDVSNYWSELADFNKAYDTGTLWKLSRVRPFLKNRALGFGLERVLYDLNPSLPCQSDLLKQYYITSAIDALKTLDALAKNLAPDTSFMDRHLAAFIASKIDIGKEVRLLDLSTIPALADNPELVVMKILAKAQQKHERLNLVGLSTWAAMRIEKMLDEIHNRVVRRQTKLQLRKLASSGSLSDVLGAVVNRDMALRDHDGFARAIALHHINHHKIRRFQNPKLIEKKANDFGGRMASMIAMVIFTITLLFTINDLVSY
jgi:hypothetical protein